MLIIVIITVCHQHSLTSVFIVASSLLYYKMCQFLSKTTFMPHSDSGFCLISIHPSSTAPMGFFFSSKKTRTALLGHIQEASFHRGAEPFTNCTTPHPISKCEPHYMQQDKRKLQDSETIYSFGRWNKEDKHNIRQLVYFGG